MTIGITGGIGSGKSTLSDKLRKAGLAVYDTDVAARRLQNENAEIRQQITALFGNEAYTDNVLNRKYIAGIVFTHPELLRQLNAIVHPAVRADFKAWAQQHNNQQIIFLECAILFEGEFQQFVDKIILITAPQSVRVQRVMQRNNISENEVIARINNQLPDSVMAAKSDIIIDTSVTDLFGMDINSLLIQLK
jgi:dephospho-CoA kinase